MNEEAYYYNSIEDINFLFSKFCWQYGSCCQAWAANLTPPILFISISVTQISLGLENYLYIIFGFGV